MFHLNLKSMARVIQDQKDGSIKETDLATKKEVVRGARPKPNTQTTLDESGDQTTVKATKGSKESE